MNSDFVARNAQSLADRAGDEGDDSVAQIRFLYRQLFGRSPNAEELRWAADFLRSDEPRRLTQYAQILLISNEMLFVD